MIKQALTFWWGSPSDSLSARQAGREEKLFVDTLLWLQSWFAAHCTEDWQHVYGIKIETLDNPGWRVEIDIGETPLEQKPFAEINRNLQDGAGWLHCQVVHRRFVGACVPNHLITVLEIFKAWAET